MTELGSQTQAQSEILGTTAKDVEAIGLVAQDSSTSIESMTMVLSRMAQNLERAEKGGTPVAFALKDIGLNAKTLLDMPIDQRIKPLPTPLTRRLGRGSWLTNCKSLAYVVSRPNSF